MSERDTSCPACGHKGLQVFHRQDNVPTNSCLLLSTRAEAIRSPKGEIRLAFCPHCGIITNTRFDIVLAEYSDRYEETQAFSPRFVRFARSLARHWVDRYDLAGKSVLEIGCGKGEFLVMMAEAGIGHGIGVDPGVRPERIDAGMADRLEWIVDFYSHDVVSRHVDAIVCRHTLEHIGPVAEFLRMVRATIGDRTDTVVLFEIPDMERVLDEVAFWDIYYEHCSYFSAGSLARLFEREGFEVLDLRSVYEGQYLILEARPRPTGYDVKPWSVDDLDRLRSEVDHFARGYARTIGEWSERLSALTKLDRTAVVWGAGSKAVSFLAIVGNHVEAAVDINPHKHGMFIAGTGHPIVSPKDLVAMAPDLVIAMNPVYLEEIKEDLDRLGVDTDLVSL